MGVAPGGRPWPGDCLAGRGWWPVWCLPTPHRPSGVRHPGRPGHRSARRSTGLGADLPAVAVGSCASTGTVRRRSTPRWHHQPHNRPASPATTRRSAPRSSRWCRGGFDHAGGPQFCDQHPPGRARPGRAERLRPPPPTPPAALWLAPRAPSPGVGLVHHRHRQHHPAQHLRRRGSQQIRQAVHQIGMPVHRGHPGGSSSTHRPELTSAGNGPGPESVPASASASQSSGNSRTPARSTAAV